MDILLIMVYCQLNSCSSDAEAKLTVLSVILAFQELMDLWLILVSRTVSFMVDTLYNTTMVLAVKYFSSISKNCLFKKLQLQWRL